MMVYYIMKKRQIISIAVLLLIIVIPLLMWLLWYFQTKKEFRVLIVDKTVLNTDVQEHSSLFWVLNQKRYVKSNGQSYNANNDYFGFYPDDLGGYVIKDFNHYDTTQLDSLANYYDMVYYTDMYGIYVAEWWDAYPDQAPEGWKFMDPAERSRLIYGRLTAKELYVLQKMKSQKKLVLTEFNIMALPTRKQERNGFEETFNLKWTKWVGRFFSELDTARTNDLPPWLIRNYIDQYGHWPFKKSGIAFVRSDDRVVVLEEGDHLRYNVPLIKTPDEVVERYGIIDEIKYPFWFEINEYSEPTVALSHFNIITNSKGDSVLNVFNIPTRFPAILRSDGDYPFYYYCADFCDNPVGMFSSNFRNAEIFSSFTYKNQAQERMSYFWKLYRPMTTEILREYYEKEVKNDK
jgi:hypothetical protein